MTPTTEEVTRPAKMTEEEKALFHERKAARIRNQGKAKKAARRIAELAKAIAGKPNSAKRRELEQQVSTLMSHAAQYAEETDFATPDQRTPADLAMIESREKNVVDANYMEPEEPESTA